MTAPESQPLTEEEKDALRAQPLPGNGDVSGLVFAAVERILATRTAALLDRLKAAEGERDDLRIAMGHPKFTAFVAKKLRTAEADKARAVAEARVALLDEVEQWIVSSAPRVGFELRYDGTEDPIAAAYVQGFREAWEAVRALRDEVSGS